MKPAIITVMCLVLAMSVSGMEKMQVITLIGQDGVSGGVSDLPNYITSTADVIEKQSGYLKVSKSGEADMDFYGMLSGKLISNRFNSMPEEFKIQGCSISPDNSRIVMTRADTTTLCVQNDKPFEVAAYLYDAEANYLFMASLPVLSDRVSCFNVLSSHTYLVDLHYCSQMSCVCTLYSNMGCEDKNGTLMMKRQRTCTPTLCKPEVEYVNWANTQIKTCAVSNVCRDTDAGADFMHFGITSKGKDQFSDACIDSTSVREYYCLDNEIVTKDLFCNPGEACMQGKCVMQPSQNQTCGIANGILRLDGDAWCSSDKTKNICKGNKVESTPMHADCLAPTCSYAGILVGQGESVCMNDGRTIAKCVLNNDEPFVYSQCSEDTQCKRNTKDIACQGYIKPVIKSQARGWSIMDLLNKLFKRGAQ